MVTFEMILSSKVLALISSDVVIRGNKTIMILWAVYLKIGDKEKTNKININKTNNVLYYEQNDITKNILLYNITFLFMPCNWTQRNRFELNNNDLEQDYIKCKNYANLTTKMG